MTTTIDPQPTLWDQVTTTKVRLSHQEAWERFLSANPWFLRRVADIAFGMKERGHRVSTKAIWEIVRPEVLDTGSKWKLDNSWTSICADRLCADWPELIPFIERRRRKS